MITSASTEYIAEALAVFRERVKPVKNKTIVLTGTGEDDWYAYAPLGDQFRVFKPALKSAGLVFLQSMESDERGRMGIVTRIVHPDSDEWIQSGHLALPSADLNDSKGMLTSARRYQLGALLGIAPVDDDDVAATARGLIADRNADALIEAPADTPQSAEPAPSAPAGSAPRSSRQAGGSTGKSYKLTSSKRAEIMRLVHSTGAEGDLALLIGRAQPGVETLEDLDRTGVDALVAALKERRDALKPKATR